ncbi:MAG: hypothetical protein JXA33_29850 [Anaerolineae bacterium]|nr:hypothetical protein [Anaerolineae bacterium]
MRTLKTKASGIVLLLMTIQIVIGVRPIYAQAPDFKFDRVISTGSLFYPGPVIQDRDGFVWLGSQGSGLFKFDGYAIQRYNAGPDSILDDNVNTLYEDRDGILWISTMGGVSQYNKETHTFTSYLHDPAQPTSISSNGGNQVLQTIGEDPSGAIWVGTSNGLNRLDKKTSTFTRYLHDPDDPNSLDSNDIFSVYADTSGIVWIGTDAGLNRLDPDSGTITRYAHDPNDPASLSEGTVLAIHEDRDGILWVGASKGLNRWDKATGTFTHYYAKPDDPEGLPDDYVRIIDEDANGNLWISLGAEGGPVTRFDKMQGTATTYRHNSRDSSTLSSDTVMGIHVSTTGIIWLTHTGGMVDKYDPTVINSTFTSTTRTIPTPLATNWSTPRMKTAPALYGSPSITDLTNMTAPPANLRAT